MKWNRLFGSFVPLKKHNPALGAIVSGLGGFASSLFSQESQQVENERNRDFAREMWNKTNEYNSPANQRKLLQEAGYNPYLFGNDYQGTGATQPATPSSSPLPGIKNGIGEGVDMFYKGRSIEQQDTSLALQAQQVQSNVDLQRMKSLETIADTMRNLYKDGGQAQVDEFMREYAPLLKSLNWSGSFFEGTMKREFLAKDIANERADLEKALISKYGEKEYQVKLNQIDQLINESKEKINLMRSERSLNRAKIEELGSVIARNFAQVGFFNSQSSQITAILPYMRSVLEDDSLRSMMDLQDKTSIFKGDSKLREYKETPWQQQERVIEYSSEHNPVTDFMRGFTSALPVSPVNPSGSSIGTKYYGREGSKVDDWRKYVYVND